jgi:cyclopropane fatty-acyl-phospholipid synthase-like methyltransferase
MEKARLGFQMTTRWSDPPIIMILLLLISLPLSVVTLIFIACKFGVILAICLAAGALYYLRYVQPVSTPAAKDQEKYLVFDRTKSPGFAKAWTGKKIPMTILVEGYLSGAVDFKNDDVLGAMQNRYDFVTFGFSYADAVFLLKQFIPGISSSVYDKKTSKREIADHYDRHTDFFNAFLGKSMVYTCAIWKDVKTETLEEAQFRKLDTICKKLQLKKGQKFLDIGCGWGTLVRRACSKFGAVATGVTLSTEGANWCKDRNKDEKTDTRILEMDYRDIPKEKFDRISAIEMAEHVGITNFHSFLTQISNMLADDGVFLMQVAGLRQGAKWEDIMWGLFMSRYIFPGADASTPLHWYTRQLENAGFEVRSVETIGKHYSHTLHCWYKNFIAAAPKLDKEKYPERLQRLWKIFLAWSVIASGQGSATCYQIVCHKNTYAFDRNRFVGEDVYGNPVQ